MCGLHEGIKNSQLSTKGIEMNASIWIILHIMFDENDDMNVHSSFNYRIPLSLFMFATGT